MGKTEGTRPETAEMKNDKKPSAGHFADRLVLFGFVQAGVEWKEGRGA